MAKALFNVEMADGRIIENVRITNADRVRFDLTRAKHNWPSFDDAMFLTMTFWVWAALRRTGQYEGTFESFRDNDCLDFEEVDSKGDKDTPESF